MIFKRRDKRLTLSRFKDFFIPRKGWRRAVDYIIYRVKRLPDTPHKIAIGLAIGVFCSFTPFFGLHIFLAALLAYLCKGNIVAALLGTFFGNPITWLKNNNELLIKTIPNSRKPLIDRNSIVPTGPTITENEGQKAQNRTYQDLIKNPDDAFNFTQLSLSNIIKITLEGKQKNFLN